jgi:hypothetical protein
MARLLGMLETATLPTEAVAFRLEVEGAHRVSLKDFVRMFKTVGRGGGGRRGDHTSTVVLTPFCLYGESL